MDNFIKYVLPVCFLLSGYTREALGCGDGCANCASISQKCLKCKHGYWLYNNKCTHCPDNCEQCSGNNNCSKCKTGFYGSICSHTCTLCNGSQCDDNGCMNGCIDGYYEDTSNVEKTCRTCHTYCTLCENQEFCLECNNGFYKSKNEKCVRCPENCENCSDGNNCSTCKNGFYGTICSQNCTLCNGSQCDDNGCMNGCIDGYYEDTSNVEKTCRKCHSNCTLCESLGICLKCIYGFYKFSYNSTHGNPLVVCYPCRDTCEVCSTYSDCNLCIPGTYGPSCQYNCSDTHCHSCIADSNADICEECENGYTLDGAYCAPEITCSENCAFGCDKNMQCDGGCNDGWSGQTCTQECASLCQTCDQKNNTICTKCKGDVFTSSCNTPCNEHCSPNATVETCSLQNGFCVNGCSNGYWGNSCNETCSERCNSTRCNQMNGFCTRCHRNIYGPACEYDCSEHCIDDNSTFICEKISGKCVSGCVDRYAGDRCERTETTRTSSVSTTTKTDDRITDEPGRSGQQMGVIIGAGAGGGVVILAIVVIVVVCVVVRRNRRKDAESVGFGDVQDVQQQSQNDIECLYAKPKKPTKEQSEDCVYAKPNKPAKEESQEYIYASPNKPKNKKSEQTEAHDNVVIDLNAKKGTDKKNDDGHDGPDKVVEQETDLDEVLLENIDDDENKDVFVEDVVIPSSDTYYNMAGLVRSHVQIAKLLDHIKNKAEFETEFEKLPQGLTRTCNEAMKPYNRAKNRYNGIYAYDATRVVLQSNNFINANYVEGYTQSQVSYIASLGPTRSTMDNFTTFWEMVWQDKTNEIIMLTNLAEAEKMKCQQYWPDQGHENVYGDFVLRCTAEKIYSDFVVRELAVIKMSETRKVTQYHYTAWPDKTVPDNVASLVEFRDKVEQGRPPVTGPMVVHCSAGIGRTGTYIALDILIREGKKEESVDIFGCVIALRGQRVNLVQNVEQYMFLHHCVLYALTCNADSLPVSTVQHTMTNEKITAQYQALVEMQSLAKGDVRLSLKFLNQNRKEIRQGSDIPGDNYRVRLTLTQNDYINAVYVNGYKNEDKFIAAQTPLPNTVEDFVSMVYQESCPCVVCLDEENINDKTVGEYLPPANKVSTFGQFQVECLSCDSGDNFTVRELKISRIGSPVSDELKVRHYQFKGWENSSSVPEHVQPFLKMIVDVEKTRHDQHTDDPIVVHCVTGAERSSLFCVVSILVEKCAAEKELSVLNTVCQVRSRRRSAIKNAEQLQFCYDCVKEIVENSDTKTYYNMNNV